MTNNKLKNISSIDAKKLIDKNKNNEHFVILDVRTPQEFNMERIDNSINIDVYSYDIIDKLNELDKNKVYFIYCLSGTRSSMLMNTMKELGFSNKLYNLTNGISEWNSIKYPTI